MNIKIDHYMEIFSSYTDEELVNRFNSLVGLRAFNFEIQAVHYALLEQFKQRSIDLSAIQEHSSSSSGQKIISTSFAKKVVLNGKQLHVID